MTLEEIAAATEWSVATVKRRLREADRLFQKRASVDPVLREYLSDGGRS